MSFLTFNVNGITVQVLHVGDGFERQNTINIQKEINLLMSPTWNHPHQDVTNITMAIETNKSKQLTYH